MGSHDHGPTTLANVRLPWSSSSCRVVLGHLFLWPTTYVGYSNEQDILPPNGLMATYSGRWDMSR